MPNSRKAPAPKKKPTTPGTPKKGDAPAPARRPKNPRPPAPKPEIVPPQAPEPKPQPSFVREASPAERKAALEAVLSKEKVDETVRQVASPPPAAPSPPPFVKESPAALRKAAVEQLAEESGVKSALSKAPWKKPAMPGGTVAPASPPPTAPTPAAPSPDRPRATMTKAPFLPTTGKSAPKTVILDTNALMMQFQFHIDIEKEVNRILGGNYEVVVPSIVLDELQRIAKEQTGKDQATARMAAELAKTFRVEDAPGDGDTGILRLAERLNAVVVTNDKRLRATLRAKDIPNIYMRSQAFLTLEGHIPGM